MLHAHSIKALNRIENPFRSNVNVLLCSFNTEKSEHWLRLLLLIILFYCLPHKNTFILCMCAKLLIFALTFRTVDFLYRRDKIVYRSNCARFYQILLIRQFIRRNKHNWEKLLKWVEQQNWMLNMKCFARQFLTAPST